MMTAEKLLRDLAEETHYSFQLLWEQKGPQYTIVQKHGMVEVNGHLFYFQEYKGGGFEIFMIASEKNDLHNCRCVVRERILS